MLWEFSLTLEDGTALEQCVVAAGVDEDAAAASARATLAGHAGLTLVRPGQAATEAAAARWREMLDDTEFPQVLARSGRMTRYARG